MGKKGDQVYAFWRPRAPSGFAVLGDCLTPLNEPPSKGVLAVNTSLVKVKRPVSFSLIWSFSPENTASSSYDLLINVPNKNDSSSNESCSIWFPVAPKGYVAVGCVVSYGRGQPSLSSALCILSSLVSPCAVKDCIAFQMADMAFWRVDNSFGSFLPANPDMSINGRAYDLHCMIFWQSEKPSRTLKSSTAQNNQQTSSHGPLLEGPMLTSRRLFEVVARFKLIWWNQGTNPRKKLSIWRPVVSHGMIFLGDLAVQGYEPPNSAIVLYDTDDEGFLRRPQDFQPVGHIRKYKGSDGINFWLPLAPPGFVSLGCIASKGPPKSDDFNSLRCIRSDMLIGDQFSEDNIWDTSDTLASTESFSLWGVGYEVGTFIVRKGFKKPPKRFALKLAIPNVSSGSDDTVIDAEIKTFSVAIFDDYGGLMVPLFNVSLSGIGFNLHGRPDYMNSTVSFSLAARSYNDKYDAWEPLIEPMDAFLRYQYDLNTPGSATQVRITSTKDLNLNISVSNANMIFQAYASWNNLSLVDEPYVKNIYQEVNPSKYAEGSVIDIDHRRNYFIIPQNKLGQDIFIRVAETTRLANIIKMPSGGNIRVKVPVSKNMLDSHLKGCINRVSQSMLTIIISEAEFPTRKGMASSQYTVAARLFLIPPTGSFRKQQSARTCGAIPEPLDATKSSVKWSEILFFKVDIVDNYAMEFVVIDMGRGEPVGIYSAPLKQIAYEVHPSSSSQSSCYDVTWRDLSAKRTDFHNDAHGEVHGRIKCAVLLSIQDDVNKENNDQNSGRRVGLIQISPTREGPWTTVRLNYASPAACWRLGNDVVASELSVKDGNRYVSIRTLVSVINNTNFNIDLRLKSKCSIESLDFLGDENENGNKGPDYNRIHMDEIFETEKYSPSGGWVSCSQQSPSSNSYAVRSIKDVHQESPSASLPDGWEWVDEWQVDATSTETPDGWVYAPDTEHLKWPESLDNVNVINYARQRRWIRRRKYTSYDTDSVIPVGLLEPGHLIPLPLSCFVHPVVSYVLQLRPEISYESKEYSWSSVVDKYVPKENLDNSEASEICISALIEADELLYCSEMSELSSDKDQGLWFCLSIQATQIGKDIQSNPIHDWKLTISSPLSITNFLPFTAEFAVISKEGGESTTCSQGTLIPGKPVKIYNADMQKPLFLSVHPQGGWDLIHEPIPLSSPRKISTKMMSLRNSYSGRVDMVIIEQNIDKDSLIARTIRIYVPFWIASARCPPLTCYFMDKSAKTNKRNFSILPHSNMKTQKVLWQITDEEMTNGYTIASALNFKDLGISVSLEKPGIEQFSPVRDLSPLGDMGGSIDLYAYSNDGKCMRLFISSKPSPYESIPTKVILVCPFMTFTNRLGRDVLIKFNIDDQPKVLNASDTRVSFVYCNAGTEKIQVRLQNTSWCLPLEIEKEDTVTIALREHHGGRTYLRVEIRGYEEGSRFLVVLRMEPENGPIRIENRMADRTVRFRQSGLGDDFCIQLEPLSTSNFSWDDPYGQICIDVSIQGGAYVHNILLEEGKDSTDLKAHGVQLCVEETGDIRVVRFVDDKRIVLSESKKRTEPLDKINNSSLNEMQVSPSPLELIIELGVVGISLIDHHPRELLYLYLEKVFISYSTGYDSGKTNRFKLILGQLQLDNQLPLTVMPVLLAPEDMPDTSHPVFKTTITLSNDSLDGAQVYPYIYVRVIDKCWRINIHEPIIWALVDFYNNLRLDSIPSTSEVAQVDPEIRIDLIDVSEIRLKLSLETSPNQRPHGALGMWGPILSAVGNAFKLQLHLRKVMHRSRFMRKSSILPSIVNRVKRDLIHNPLHIIFSVDVLSMTKSTLASLSKGFAELSTDRQFLQLRSKQVWSRRITGFGDGFLQGTEAFAQGVAFGVTGVLTKPVENARQHGFLGLAHGIGRAFLGVVVQPLSGALDFVSLTVDGIGASFVKCLDIINNKATAQRRRNPRAIQANGVIKEYCEREAVGQMILYLAEASRHLSCTDLFKEPSKYAWSDFYEDHFIVPYQRIVLVTSKRVMLLQSLSLEKLDRKPSKIVWDVPWEELLALELAKAGHNKPSHLIIHLKHFRKSESFVRVVRCNVDEEEGQEPQAVMICSCIRRMWKAARQSDLEVLTLKVPSSQRHVQFAWDESNGRDSYKSIKPMIKPRGLSSAGSLSDEMRFKKHCVNFRKIWSSEQEYKSRCTLFPKQVVDDGTICSIWRPFCPNGYVSVGDVAHIGNHQPHVAAIYRESAGNFSLPVGYDLVWRNCSNDYNSPLSIWLPRPPDGFIAVGCVAVSDFEEPPLDSAYCVSAELAIETEFEEQMVWSAPDSYPWACYIYQVHSEALQFIALRQLKEESDWKPMRVSQHDLPQLSEASADQ
ncbi:uncharacterized protein LOC110092030 [Dendrobium catenatum]|nr:uncharacterized protein LOC110092030 [Dendrobium catenatum]